MNIGQIRVPYNFLELTVRHNEPTGDEEEKTQLVETTPVKLPSKDNTASYHRLCVLTKITIAMHTFSCLIITIGTIIKMSGNNGVPRFGGGRIWRVASCWGGTSMDNSTNMSSLRVEDLYITNRMSTSVGFERIHMIAFLLIIFFLLSALFQLMSLRNPNHRDNILKNRPQWYRYIEYSLSASCMIIAIFISFGMLESYLHVAVFTLTFLCMIIGLAADYVRHLADTSVDAGDASIPQPHLMKLRLVSLRLHYIGWIPMMVVWGILFFVVFDMANATFWQICGRRDETNTLPDFVWIVVVGEFALFNAFGYVQWLQISKQFDINMYKLGKSGLVVNTYFLHPDKNYEAAAVGLTTERKFIVLSLLAKSLLGWTIFSQVIMV